VRVGGAATVRLDAFPKQPFAGRVRRVSPAANPTSRLVPVELAIPNPTGRVGSGLLARASFTQPTTDRVVVPLSALQIDRANAKQPDRAKAEANTQPTKGKIFVVRQDGEQATAVARSVGLGERLDGKVEIVSGLNPGERFVVRASQPIEDGASVRLSILSAK
jgi:HlyD family secretion protein